MSMGSRTRNRAADEALATEPTITKEIPRCRRTSVFVSAARILAALRGQSRPAAGTRRDYGES